MGLAIKELVEPKTITFADLSQKKVAVDSFNILYQFLTTIRQSDGSPLTDSEGRMTSHLNGLFNRSVRMLQEGIRPAFVFDGKAPELKRQERERRAKLKEAAQKEYEIAKERKDIAGMKKYAGRTVRLEPEMIAEAKELIRAMGMPVIEAPSEGEAQAAHMARKGDFYATVSQDFDTLVYGTPRLVRNLSVAGRKRRGATYETVSPEIISLSDFMNSNRLDPDQLIVLAILIGTDYNYGGIKGIGPVKALKLLHEHGTDFDTIFEEVKWEEHFDIPWMDIYYTFKNMPTSADYDASWKSPDDEKIRELLVEKHDFSPERVDAALSKLSSSKSGRAQKGLGEFFG